MSGPGRILIVAPSDIGRHGGVETHVRELAGALAAGGHPTTIITPGSVDRTATESEDGVAVRTVRVGRTGLGAWLRAVGEESARHDVAHLHGYHLAMSAVAAVAVAVPYAVTLHYHGGGHTALASLAHPAYRAALGGRMVRRAGAIIAVSEAERRLVARDFRRDAAVIPNGVRPRGTEAEPLEVGGDGGCVLTVARLEAYKHVDTLIDAIAATADMHLIVVGDGPERGRLAAQAERAAPGRVHLLGAVGEETLERAWARADVYATASEKEAYGICVAEAAATGIGVVASGIQAHKEAHGGGDGATWMHPHATADEWAEALAVRAARMPEPATRPTWEQVADGVAEVLTQVRSGDRR